MAQIDQDGGFWSADLSDRSFSTLTWEMLQVEKSRTSCDVVCCTDPLRDKLVQVRWSSEKHLNISRDQEVGDTDISFGIAKVFLFALQDPSLLFSKQLKSIFVSHRQISLQRI